MPNNDLSTNDAIPALRADLQAVGRSAFARGMVWGTSDNISGKLPDGCLLMSKAGTDLAAPGFDDDVLPEATSKIRMHRAAHAHQHGLPPHRPESRPARSDRPPIREALTTETQRTQRKRGE